MTTLRSPSDLSAFVRIHRQKRGWTQAELGERAGIAEKHVNRIENSANEPRVSTVMALLAALGFELVAERHDGTLSRAQSVKDLF